MLAGLLLCGTFYQACFGEEQAQAAGHPNVIVVMADDLGIGDVSPTNPDCKIKTPHLQKMAEEGLTFLDAHTTSSVCTPTRYGLLTGRYNWRSRLARGVLNGRSSHLIPADRPTLGHLMRKGGYHTAMIGKWHLGWDWHKTGKQIDFTKPVKNGPDINGFNQYYGHCGSLDMPPYVWVDTGRITAQPDRQEGVSKGQDRYGWYRKGPIGSDFKIPEVLPHLFDKSIEYVKARADAAKAGKPFFLYLPLPAPHTPIVPIPPFKGSSGLNPYADFVMQMDHHMGQLLASLKEFGLDKNTLVIFTCDNGTYVGITSKLRDGTIIKGGKGSMPDAGNRVPFIANWPGTIKPSQVKQDVIDFSDLLPTLCEAAGAKIPSDLKIDGRSFYPLLGGNKYTPREYIYMWYGRNGGPKGQAFTRDQRYKLYRTGKFYDVSKDPLEKNPLLEQALKGSALTAHEKLAKALALYKDARTITSTKLPGEKKGKPKKKPKKQARP